MGNGLSMASAWGIIHHQGGFMEPSGNGGSKRTFNVYLPDREKEIYDYEYQALQENSESATILVVDDDEMALEVMAEMLRLLGYRVLTAERGRKALGIYKRRTGPIDLVLLDIMMPEMTGDIVFQELKAMDPDVKVICASGYCPPETIEKMLSDGCCGYFPKPVNLSELARHVHRVLKKQPQKGF